MGDPSASASQRSSQIQDTKAQKTSSEAQDARARLAQRILCVDDTESNRYTRGRVLRAEGFEIIEAVNGSNALRLAAEEQPSLVLLDIQLPDINGFAVCRQLKSNPKTSHIPVLHISSLGKLDHEYPEALESGAEAYLQEPVEPSVLVAVIRALIRAASAEATARKAERDAVDILESVGEAMFLMDQDYRYEYVNAEAERLLGLERASLIGKTRAEVFPDSVGNRADREFHRVMAERTPSLFENFYEPWQKWFEVKASPVSGGGIAVYFRDITGRKEADKERERLVRDLTERTAALNETVLFPEQNPQPILRVREDGVLLYANPSSIALLAEWNCGVGHAVPVILRQAVERARTEGAVRELEIEVNGREYSFLITPLKDGAYANLYGRDITERKLTEQVLRESRAHAQRRLSEIEAIYESAPVGLCVLDTDLRFVRVNARFAETSGWPADAHIGKTPGELNPDMGPIAEEALRRVLETGEPLFDLEVRGVTAAAPSVPRIWIEHWIPLKDAAGRITGVSISAEEVTERKRAEQALREREERFRTLVSASSEVLYRMSPDWTEMRYLGGGGFIADQERPSKEWLEEYIPPEDRPKVLDAIQRAIRTKSVFELEHRVRRVDGGVGWTLSRAVPLLDAQDEISEWFGAASDVTERKRAELALRDSEERYRRLFTTMIEGFAVGEAICDEGGVPADFRFLEMNEGFERQSGLGRDILGKPMREVLPNLEQVWIENYCRVALTGESMQFEQHNRDTNRDYSVFCYSPSRGRFAILFSDITGRKQTEDALRASEEQFRTLANAIPQLCWMANEDGWIFWYNQRWYEYTGTTPEQMEGWGWQSVHDPDVLPKVLERWKGSIATGEPFDMVFPLRGADGAFRPFLTRVMPLRDRVGNVTRWFGTNTDISEQRKAEEALRDSEERLRLAQEAADIGTFEWNIQTGVNTWSPKLEQLYGLPVGSFGRTQTAWESLVHPEDRAEAVERVKRAFETGEPVEAEFRVIWPDGSVHWITGRWQVFKDASGVPQRLTGVHIDITQRKQTEERLRHAQKLESLGLLAGGVAHDFNNLLVGVIGNASLAQEMLPPDHPATELIGTVVRTGEQAAHLTRQMLAYSGKGKFLLEPLNLSVLARDIIELARPSIPKKIALHLELDQDLPFIEADRGQVQQILMNLAINAGEAIGSHDGLITVRAGTQVVDDAYLRRHPEAADLQPGPYVVLEVRDTGCGMDEAVKAKIFDPFYSTKFTGRGLGLAAVAGIVRGHKGAIVVTSAPGKGSTFAVLFPPAAHPAKGRQDAAPRAASQGSGVVLVIDDEKVVRDMSKRALERQGYTVLVADGGLAAIDLLKRHPGSIDLAVLDLSMPGMSGEEALPELRKIRPELKVFVSSGYSESEAMTMFRGQRVSGFVQKPYTSAVLAEKVKGALG